MSRIAVRSMMLCVGTAAASLTISTLFAFGTSTPPASLTTLDTAYTQNFDTLATVGASNALPAGWSLEESGTSTRNDGNYTAGTGSDNAGDVYAFGPAGSTDRAFGTLLSGTLTPIIGASFTNNTGATITSLDISYTAEQWRCGATGRADELDFQYSTTATGLNRRVHGCECSQLRRASSGCCGRPRRKCGRQSRGGQRHDLRLEHCPGCDVLDPLD